MEIVQPKYKILILHALRDIARQTTIDHIYCYPRHRRGNLYAYHHAYAPVSEELRSFPFDAIILNYCFLHQRIHQSYEILKRQHYSFIANSPAIKIAISQDEMTCNAILDEWLDYMNVDVIFTPVQNDLDVLFPICSTHSKIKHAFAGYSEPSEIERLAQCRRPFAERVIDVGTRVRATPPHYGRAGLVKARSAERFRDTASAAGFAVDISTEPRDAFTGDEWFHFLGSCRFTLVARGGASACDPRGEIGRAVAEFVKASPQATFEEIEAACFPGRDRYDFTAITPRLFEAAALHTGLILLEGDYVAGLVPYKHYIPLKADFSNLREVFALMRDDAGAEAMIAAAYEHLVQSGLFSYRRFVDDVFDEIVAASPEPRHASAADFTQLQRHYQRLAPYQRLAMESPPNWLHIAPQACNRAEMLGQRESILALIEARRRGSDARSVMAAMIEAGGRLDPTVAALATEAIAALADDDGSNLDALAALANAPPQQLSGFDYGRYSRSCEYIYDPLPEPSNLRNSSVDPVDPEGCTDRTGLPAHALGDPLIEPRPYSGSQAARLGADRWAALRRLLQGLRDDPSARIALAERAVPAGKDGGSCEGMLCAAFLLAPAAVNAVQSNGYFCELLRQLPELPFDHDFWISLTAFATIASANTAARFDEFLDQRGVLTPEALAKWPLAARTNFLTYCVRHQRLAPALAIVHQARANWSPADNGADAWAFRLAALTVLENAKAYDQLSAHIKAYHELLEGRRIDSAVRANIKVQIELLMAASLRARALDQLALSHYQQAISLIEACPSSRLSSGALAGLLLTVGKFHEEQRHFAKAQACYERSVIAAESATGKHDLLAALGGLALLSIRQGRHAEAVALYRRRVALIESDPKLGEAAKIFANNQLAAALVATGDKSSGWQLFDQTVAAISRGRPPNQALMAATLLARIDAGLAELSDDTLRQDVRALTESTALSIMHCQSLLRLAERAIDADRTKLAADIAAAVSDRSLDVAASNPAQAAPLLLSLARAVQRLGGDPRTASDLLHHCVRTMAELAGSTDNRLRLPRQLIDVRLALFEHRLAETPEADLLDDTKQLLEDIGEFLPRQMWVCLSIAQRAFDSAYASVASSIIAAVAAVASDFVRQNPMEVRALFRRLAQLTMRKLEFMAEDASLDARISCRAAIYAGHYCSVFTERGELFSREPASALAALALAIVAARSSGSCVDWMRASLDRLLAELPGRAVEAGAAGAEAWPIATAMIASIRTREIPRPPVALRLAPCVGDSATWNAVAPACANPDAFLDAPAAGDRRLKRAGAFALWSIATFHSGEAASAASAVALELVEAVASGRIKTSDDGGDAWASMLLAAAAWRTGSETAMLRSIWETSLAASPKFVAPFRLAPVGSEPVSGPSASPYCALALASMHDFMSLSLF